MYRVDTEAHGSRKEDRGKYEDDGGWFHHVACQEQHHVDEDQEGHDPEVLAENPVGHGLGDILVGHQEREEYRVGDDIEQHGAQVGRVEQDAGHILHPHVLVDKDGDEERIHRRHGGRLGCGKDAGIDAADDDYHEHQSPDTLTEGTDALTPGGFWQARVSAFLGDIPGNATEHDRKQYPRNQAGNEESADGGIGRDSVNHLGDRG